MAKSKAEESRSRIGAATGFFNDSWAELKKVHAPTRQETVASTLGVLLMIVVFSVTLGIIDWGVGSVMKSFLYK